MSSKLVEDKTKTLPFYGSCLVINRLRLPVKLGQQPGERLKAQPIELDIRFYYPHLPPACKDDDGDFICYDEVCEMIIQLVSGKEYRLIEFLTMEIYKALRDNITHQLITRSDDIKVWIHLRKCVPPVPYMLEGASFIYSDLPPDAVLVPR